METERVLITHKNCQDGTGCVLVSHYYDYKNNLKPRKIIYCQYGKYLQVPDVVNKDVIIADFSFDRETMKQMKKDAKSLIVLDHHASAEKELEGLNFCIFDMEESGATLLWKYLFPDKDVADLFKYIKDRDIWRWELPNSKEVSAGLSLLSGDINAQSKYTFDVTGLIEKGKTVLEYQDQQVSKILKIKKYLPRMIINGYNVICINTTTLISEIGNALSIDEPFVAMYFDTDKARVYALRSNAENKDYVDVSIIAKLYGGGGHKHAAGFSTNLPTIVPLVKTKEG